MMRISILATICAIVLASDPARAAQPPRFLAGSQHIASASTPDLWTGISVARAHADFNRDGREDVLAVYTTHAGENLAVFPGDIAGGVGTAILTPLPDAPWPLVTGDFDEDGQMDVLGVLGPFQRPIGQTGQLGLFFGRRNGTFVAGPMFTVGTEMRFVTGDFDADGHVDLALSYGGYAPWDLQAGHLEIWLGDGRGGWAVSQDVPTAPALFQPIALRAAADFNGDGRLDVLGSRDALLHLFLGRGDGTVNPAAVVTNGFLGTYADGIGDFDRDGVLDVFRVASDGFDTPQVVRIGLGRGDGTFVPDGEYRLDLPGQTNDALTGDFDGDGITDIVAGVESEIAELLLGRGDGTFRPPVPFLSGANTFSTLDLDRDGRVDLVSSGIRAGELTVVRGDARGLGSPIFRPAPAATLAAAGDVSGDLVPDVVAAEYPNGNEGMLAVYPGRLGGGFGTPVRAALRRRAQAAATGDLDGDGDADVVVGSVPADGYNLELFRGSPGGTPVPAGDLSNGSGAAIAALALGDLDRDGDLDLVTSTFGQLAVQLNRGDGTFAAPIQTGLGHGATQAIVIDDFDADGELDVVALAWTGTADVAGMNLLVHHGNGDGTLTLRQILFLDGNYPRAAVGSLDGDDLPDLYVTGSPGTHGGSGGLYALRNSGGTFVLASRDPSAAGATMAVADMNSDGAPDLATLEYDFFLGAVLRIRPNDPVTGLGPPTSLPAPGDPEALAVGNFAGNALPDLIVFNFSRPASFGVYENVTPGVLAVGSGARALAHALAVSPNPCLGSTRLRFSSTEQGDLAVRILDIGGRLVRELVSRAAGPGVREAVWDGRDAGGSPVPAGVYFALGGQGRGAASARILRLR